MRVLTQEESREEQLHSYAQVPPRGYGDGYGHYGHYGAYGEGYGNYGGGYGPGGYATMVGTMAKANVIIHTFRLVSLAG